MTRGISLRGLHGTRANTDELGSNRKNLKEAPQRKCKSPLLIHPRLTIVLFGRVTAAFAPRSLIKKYGLC